MKLLILKGFNNYFNRIIKRYDTVADYISNSDAYYDFSNINFNPNDGVTTTQVIGSVSQQQTGGADPVPLAWEHEGNPDYLIAYETEQVGIATVNTIKSRWFIVESVRTRNGQYSLKLKRDSIADHFDTLLSCPAFIKKGTITDDNPLIVNSEGVTVNQIKSGETLLKDKTGSAWIVGYMAKNAPAATITEQIPDETQIDFETLEDIASEFGVDVSDLGAALTDDPDNPSYFINDNIEIVGWVNWENNNPLEFKMSARSSDNLASFTYSFSTGAWHTQTSDCFCKLVEHTDEENLGQIFGNAANPSWKNAVNAYKSSLKSNWKTITSHPFFTKNLLEKLSNMVSNKTKIYKAGKYYIVKINGSTGPTNTGEDYPFSAIAGVGRDICNQFIVNFNNATPTLLTVSSLNRGQLFINYNEVIANFYLEEVSTASDIPGITVTMSSTRNAIQNQPYDMFAIPYSNTIISDGVDEHDVVGEYAQKIAMALIKQLTNANVYDIQLLPYCPFVEAIGDNNIDIVGLTEHYDYDFVTKTDDTLTFVSDVYTPRVYSFPIYEVEVTLTKPLGTGTLTAADITVIWTTENHTSESLSIVSQDSTSITLSLLFEHITLGQFPKVQFTWDYTSPTPVIKSIILYPKTNSFSINLDYTLSIKESMKIDSQTDMYRLVSPNYQGSFDFNVAKNGGSVSGFVADCTYKPYTPYIKVSPYFSWLYGSNYGDCRGLICGGDFSIGFLQDAWENYQLNNKNYQNIFNREIQNLDVNQSIQRTQQYLSGGLNIVRDAIAGGVGGGLATGSPYGAIAGAAIGGIGSGIGYGIDMNLMEKGLQEQRQFSIDKFRMQLGNIQALPYTLTKVGAFNINSKVWPFLEYYTCSEQEKEALKMKIQYEGMTVGIVDYLGNYMSGGYVQADLIRNETIIEDSHLLDDIYIELTKGVYM